MSGWRVLIVEDCLEIATLEADVVSMTGSDPTIASDGAQALGSLATSDFDLVLLDLDLPTLSGQAVLERMFEHPKLRLIPVLIISGTIEGLRKTSQVVNVLEKPFEVAQLQNMIRRALAHCPKH